MFRCYRGDMMTLLLTLKMFEYALLPFVNQTFQR
ncbi:hypothetical protein SAMN04488128_1011114 [Chitinophaga eiseniae]|uniref:Uncharacterized protein n=1 Tax=Chitinophaga eiseniae TaxID=634771 RepID=A0A1T4MHA0_9BACT|nr:hypothetical protein SAMN04488128_1011114 [Chitinophaga eiseniae]